MIASSCTLYLVYNKTEGMFYIRMWFIQKQYLLQLYAPFFY